MNVNSEDKRMKQKKKPGAEEEENRNVWVDDGDVRNTYYRPEHRE